MSAHAATGTLGHAMRKAGVVTPRERLDAAARRIIAAQPPERRASALLTVLAGDMPALWELMQPVAHARADEFLRSLAQAGEGEGQPLFAEQAKDRVPSPDQSPQGGDAGQSGLAEQAKLPAPASQHSAPVIVNAPSRPAGNIVPVTAHLRSKPGTSAARPIATVTPGRMSEQRLSVDAIRAARRVAATGVLSTFRIGDIPLGEATPEMCRTFIRKRRRDAVFIERVIQGVPDGCRIAAHVTEAMAEQAYREANKELFNV